MATPHLTRTLLATCLAAGGCATDAPNQDIQTDPIEPLVLPDVSGIDFPAAFRDAVQLSKQVHAGVAWSGHAGTLDRRSSACPDLYVGAPDDASVDVDADPEDIQGFSWFDLCTTSGGSDFSGFQYWDASVAAEGDAETAEGRTVDATRTLVGDGVVSDAKGVRFEFSGEATDSLSDTQALKYRRWTWSSSVSGTLTGIDVFDDRPDTPYGYRTDMSFYATGGDTYEYQPDGNIFLFDQKLHDRFDSVEMDLAFLGEGAAGPDDCTDEPRGWIGLRDENAYWYDIVFLPRYDDDITDTGADEPYTSCDGCGTVYVRGVESGELGEICVDFSFVFSDEPLTPPGIDDYVLSLHGIDTEAP